MDICSTETRRLAYELIMEAEHNYGLRLNGGMLAIPGIYVKAHKWTTHQARERFGDFYRRLNFSSRESVLLLVPFLIHAYRLVPRTPDSLHHALDFALEKDGLRIRDGELRRIVVRTSRGIVLQHRKE